MKKTKTTITQRWLVGSLGLTFLVLLIVWLAFSVLINTYYYSYAKQYMTTKMNTVSTSLQQLYDNNPNTFSTEVRSLIENWSDKDTIELMSLNSSSTVTMTSSGFLPSYDIIAQDVTDAIESGSSGYYVGKISTGEKIIAVSIVTPDTNGDYSVIRIISSVAELDKQIAGYILIVGLFFIAMIILTASSGLYFVKSIVLPVRQLGASAKRYARGDFSRHTDVQSDDEIGELCDIVNKMADDLSQSEAMRNEFISGVSHELRTPLTAIRGWAETIYAMPDDRETIEKGMSVITKETDRLSNMVEELLDFSRMQNGKFSLNKDNVDIIAELGDAVLIYTEKARKEGIELIYNEIEDIIVVYGDRSRLRQVFINIIDNAIKYSEKEGLVTIQVVVKENKVEIEISDTGCGISVEDLPKVKTKFFRANHNKRGSGIGLAVADEIITMHSGTLELYSELGLGTTVVITLPIYNP